MPTTSSSCSSTLAAPFRRRRRQTDGRNLLESLSCLWKAPGYSSDRGMKTQASTNTFLGEEEEDSTEYAEEEYINQIAESSSLENGRKPSLAAVDYPPENATPRELLTYYEGCLQVSGLEWTERANLYYTTGCLHAQLRDYGAATTAFEAEANILRQQGAGSDALVPIYRGLAKLWTVRQPQIALKYYERALQCCTDPREAQDLRHVMGRLLFQTGNLERAMQITIG